MIFSTCLANACLPLHTAYKYRKKGGDSPTICPTPSPKEKHFPHTGAGQTCLLSSLPTYVDMPPHACHYHIATSLGSWHCLPGRHAPLQEQGQTGKLGRHLCRHLPADRGRQNWSLMGHLHGLPPLLSPSPLLPIKEERSSLHSPPVCPCFIQKAMVSLKLQGRPFFKIKIGGEFCCNMCSPHPHPPPPSSPHPLPHLEEKLTGGRPHHSPSPISPADRPQAW